MFKLVKNSFEKQLLYTVGNQIICIAYSDFFFLRTCKVWINDCNVSYYSILNTATEYWHKHFSYGYQFENWLPVAFQRVLSSVSLFICLVGSASRVLLNVFQPALPISTASSTSIVTGASAFPYHLLQQAMRFDFPLRRILFGDTVRPTTAPHLKCSYPFYRGSRFHCHGAIDPNNS